MLQGLPATEQCFVIDGVNFLNNADIDGYQLPPKGAPNIMMAAGGAQLKGILEDDKVFYWNFMSTGKIQRTQNSLVHYRLRLRLINTCVADN